MKRARERAEAKLTVSLHMVGLRSDGYHLIESEMVSLSLHDTLEIDPSSEGLALGAESTVDVEVGPDNLIASALRSVNRKASVVLEKHIPLGAGLGGGSADAAAVLRWAGEFDPQVAARIGSDVPFCLQGGRALVSGVGERVTPLSYIPRDYTLLVPPVHVDTASVYRAFDELGRQRRRAENDLEVAAIAVAPVLGVWRDRMAEWTGHTPHLAGSGATWFVAGHHPAPDAVEAQKARWVHASTTPGFE